MRFIDGRMFGHYVTFGEERQPCFSDQVSDDGMKPIREQLSEESPTPLASEATVSDRAFAANGGIMAQPGDAPIAGEATFINTGKSAGHVGTDVSELRTELAGVEADRPVTRGISIGLSRLENQIKAGGAQYESTQGSVKSTGLRGDFIDRLGPLNVVVREHRGSLSVIARVSGIDLEAEERLARELEDTVSASGLKLGELRLNGSRPAMTRRTAA